MKRLANTISLAKLSATLKQKAALDKQLQHIIKYAISDLDDIPDQAKEGGPLDPDLWKRLNELAHIIQRTPEIKSEVTDAFLRHISLIACDYADDDLKQ